MGVQVPRGFHTEVPQKGVVRGFEAIFGRSVAPIGRAKGESDRRGAPDAGPCAHSWFQHFWARGYFVPTVGRDEAVIREYIRNRERQGKGLEQMGLWR